MSCDPSKTCPVCDQRGLPILPLRYAVARCDADVKEQAPPLVAPFGDGVTSIPLPTEQAQYTLRLLRPGYLYVFNEVRGEWKAYVVNDDAYLMPFDVHSSTPPNIQDAEPCARMQNSAAGRCVMIPDATHAGAVWMAFTDTAWTQTVLDRHRKEAYRKLHMQRIDVKAWATSAAQQPHLDALAKLATQVCEFALPAPPIEPPSAEEIAAHEAEQAGKPASERSVLLPTVTIKSYPTVDFSLHSYFNEQPTAELFIDQVTAAANKLPPAMMALHDPVGVTMELARLAGVRLEKFITARDVARPLVISKAIKNLQQAIMEDAENRQIYQTERDARNLVLDTGYMGMGDGGAGARGGQAIADLLFPEQRKAREALYEKWRNPSREELKTARTQAWSKYTKKLDNDRLTTWRKQWDARMRAFDQHVVLPLVGAHVKWITSPVLLNKLDCCHDPADIHSGKGFLDTMIFCIQDTQEYIPCREVYLGWLQATQIDRENLILRAFGYNQKEILDQLSSVSQGGLSADSLKGLPWDGLINGYDKALEALGNGSRSAVVSLTVALGGCFTQWAGKAVDGVIGPALVALGVVARAPVVMVEVTMSKANAITELTTRMMAINPKLGQLKDLNRAIDLQMRKAGIYGVPVKGTGKFRYLIMADPKVVEDFPGVGANGQPSPRRFSANALLTETDRAQMTQLRWRKIFPANAGLGLVTGILQIAAMNKLADDLDKSMQNESTENEWRFRSSVVGLAGTLTETTGNWVKSVAEAGNRLAIRLEKYVGVVLRIGGKVLGIGAGVVMAVWDGIRGWKELQEGNGWLGALYLSSAFGAGIAIFAFSGWGALLFGTAATGVGIVLVVLVIVIAVLIEVFKDNKVQDWLERCCFGKFEADERYKDSELELKELKLALEG